MAGIKLYGDWGKASKVMRNMQMSLDKVVSLFLHKETNNLRAHILEVFRSQGGPAGWKPLSKWTLAMRRFRGFGGTSILQQSGQLRNSIINKVDAPALTGFVGVLYQTKRGRERMVNIAKVHEFGSKTRRFKPSPKQRRFLMMVGTKMGLFSKGSGGSGRGRGVYIFRIPPRPFMQPGAKSWKKGFKSRTNQFFKKMFSRG